MIQFLAKKKNTYIYLLAERLDGECPGNQLHQDWGLRRENDSKLNTEYFI